MTAAEIHQLGLDELQRVHAEMRLLFDQLAYPQNELLQQLFGRLANDGGIVTAANLLSTYETIPTAISVDCNSKRCARRGW